MDNTAEKLTLPDEPWPVGGEMGRVIRSIAWDGTPLGPVASWPQSLRTSLSILLSSKARMILFWGKESVVLYNEACLPLFGTRHPRAFGIPARDGWPEVWNILEPLLIEVMRTGEAPPVKNPLFPLDRPGSIEGVSVDFSCAPVRGESGRVTGVLCFVHEAGGRSLRERRIRADAAARERMALRGSEERFRRCFDLGLTGTAITSPTQGCIAVNDEICKILGYERDELLKRSWAELTHPDDLAAEVAQFNRVMAGELEGYSLHKRFIRKDGRVMNAVVSVKCLRRQDGSVDSFLAFLQEVTERKKTEERALLQTDLLNVVEQAVITVDLDGVITFWNRFAEKLYGWRSSEVIGRNFLEIFPSSFPQRQVNKIMSRLRAGKSWSGEVSAERRDGSTFPAMVVNTPIFDREGKVIGVIGISSDMTVKKEAEAILMRKTVAAEELSRLKSRFVSMVSHELRTPLNAIVGFSALLKDRRVDADPSRRSAMVEHIHRNAKNLVDLINTVLDLSKIEAGKMMIRKTEVSLVPLLREIVTDLKFSAEEKGLILELREGPELPPLFSDPGMLRQIFANLISNAVKFTRVGSIEVRIYSWTDRKRVRVEVEDTGIGIEPDALPHLFEPFFQVDREGGRSGSGTGLGLAIVNEFTRLLGGTIEVVSRPQAGSRFTVTLPLERPETAR